MSSGWLVLIFSQMSSSLHQFAKMIRTAPSILVITVTVLSFNVLITLVVEIFKLCKFVNPKSYFNVQANKMFINPYTTPKKPRKDRWGSLGTLKIFF